MGRATPHQNFVLPPGAAELPDPLIPRSELGDTLDLAALFGLENLDRPVEVEVGFGKGRFILEESASRPDTLFLGIERAVPYVRLVRYRLLASGNVENVRVIAHDANDVFRRVLAPASIEQVHVLFPDPWPKRKHHRRRIVQPAFIELVARVLRVGGRLNIVTDHADYAIAIQKAVAQVPRLERQDECALGPDFESRSHFAVRLAEDGATFQGFTWVRRE